MKIKNCIMFSTADWDAPYWTNKQHMAKKLAASGVKVLYVESIGLRRPSLFNGADVFRILKRIARGLRGIQMVDEHIFVLSPLVIPFCHNFWMFKWVNEVILGRAINRYIKKQKLCKKSKATIIWSYHPYLSDYSCISTDWPKIYHCVDDLSSVPGVSADQFLLQEASFIKKAELVFATSHDLYQRCKVKNSNTFFFSNVVDREHFANEALSLIVRENINSIGKPRIVYSGVLSEYKVDFDLLFKVFSKRMDWNLVLIGGEPEGQRNSKLRELIGLSNVFCLGYVGYDLLPGYLQNMDIGLLPTLKNQYTKHMFPMKYFEYIASGLPVVSTSLAFLDKAQNLGVQIGDSESEFIDAIEMQLSHGKLSNEISEKIVGQNTWDARTEKMLALVEVLAY